MAIYKNSTPVITNGLLLYLDAANIKSYSRSGTTWNDLSGNNYNLTFYGTSSYDESNQKSIFFTGSLAVASSSFSSTPLTTNALTLECWVKHNVLSAALIQRYVHTFTSGSQLEQAVIRTAGYIGLGSIHFYIRTGTGNGTLKFCQATNQLVVNQWYHIVGTWDGSNTIIYKNGLAVQTTAQTGTLVSIGSGTLYVSSNGEAMQGNIPFARIYNRALSQAEVQQNYNVQKSRFELT